MVRCSHDWETYCVFIYPVSLSSCVSRISRKTCVTLQQNNTNMLPQIQPILFTFSHLHSTGTFTFGPGGPWMPGCPCIHLQDAFPAVRPISAYPPHCRVQRGEKKKQLKLPTHISNRGLGNHVERKLTHHTRELTAALGISLLWVTWHLHLLEVHLERNKRQH